MLVSKSKTNPGKDLDRILDKLLACELEEDARALLFLKVRPHRSSIVKSYGRLKIISSNMKTRKYSIWELGKSRFWSGLVLVVQIRAARANQA